MTTVRLSRPLIGVVPLWDDKLNSLWMLPGYFDGIIEAGGIPVMLPLTDDETTIGQLVGQCDGFLVTGAANTAVIVAQTKHQLDADLYYGRKEYSDELDVDWSDAGPAPTPTTAPAVPPRLPNAVLLASGGDACCGIRPGK